MKIIFYTLSIFFVTSCNMMEYSPNQAFDRDSPQDLNKKNLEKLAQNPGDDTIRFVLTGDSQRAYKNAQDLVNVVNKIEGLDFVLLAGDISDFGLLGEMEWVNEIFSKIKVPYIGVIGNHDLVANGQNVYTRMYGPLNFSFTYQGVKFVCHNTNCREVNFNGTVPSMNWLKNEFSPAPGVKSYIAVAHVPPSSVDFDKDMRSDYTKLLNSSGKTLAALYAHNHSEDIEYHDDESIPYLITNAIVKRQFLLVEIVDGKLSYESIRY
jgi:3',5'-cyclic-AMP phosphodiesterase